MTKRLTVSVSDEDAAFLELSSARFNGNTSAAIHDLVRVSRELRAAPDYARAFAEFEESGDADLWDGTAADGIAR